MSTLKVNNVQSITKYAPYILDSSGEEVGKFASAWVAFQDDGSILNSSNVISITFLGAGRYKLSLTPNLRINNPAVSGSTMASTNIVHCNIFDSNISDRRNQMSVFGSSIRVAFKDCTGATVTAQEGSTYHTVSVVGDNEYASGGNMVL